MNHKHLTRIFFFCLLWAILALSVMVYYSRDFRFNDPCETPFTIMTLLNTDSEAELREMYSSMTEGVKNSLRAHLFADYFFMAGCYPAIVILCLLVAIGQKGFLRKAFIALAVLQVFPWLFDVAENIQLTCRMDDGCDMSFAAFRFFVISKFGIAGVGFLLATLWLIRRAIK